MNRVNKITSIVSITIFSLLWLTPILSAADCDMDCCKIEVHTCEMIEMANSDCCQTMTDCSNVIYVPVVSAPIVKVNPEKELTLEYIAVGEISQIFTETFSLIPYNLKFLNSQVHSGFQTPLLV